MIALGYGDRATGLELPPENRQRLNRLGEMLQDEANEDVVERLGVERQSEDVRMPESHIGQSSRVGNLPGLGDRLIGDIDRMNCASGLRLASVTVWAPMPHPTSSTRLPPRYSVSECSRLTRVPA